MKKFICNLEIKDDFCVVYYGKDLELNKAKTIIKKIMGKEK